AAARMTALLTATSRKTGSSASAGGCRKVSAAGMGISLVFGPGGWGRRGGGGPPGGGRGGRPGRRAPPRPARPTKKYVARRRTARAGRLVDVGQAGPAVPQVAFFFEDAQEGADGGPARGVGQVGVHLDGGRPAAPVHHVHDLPLAPAQSLLGRICHRGPLP